MIMKLRYLLADPRFMAREGEGTPDADATPDPNAKTAADELNAAAAAATADAAAKAAAASAAKTFTQDQVNEFVVKRNKAVQAQLEQTEAQYETLLAGQSLSTQEKVDLKGQLDNLQTQMRTKEQQATYDAKKAAEAHAAKLNETSEQLGFYKNQFETSTRNNAIMAAATQHDAFNPELFIDVLSPRTEIQEETNEQGEKTGRLVPKVKVTRKTEDGTVAEVFVTPAEAIEDMKGQPEKYGGLFRGNVAKGIGEGSNSDFTGTTRVDVAKMSDEEYFKNHEAIRAQYGIRDRKTGF
jgi:hypothetical protein